MHDLPYYVCGEQRLPRLTRVLSILRDPDLDAWRKRVGEATADRAMHSGQRRGTLLHTLIAKTLSAGKLATLPKTATQEVRNCWTAWTRWYQLQPPMTPQAIEHPLISATLGYGATPDLIELAPLRITDWKTGSRLKDAHWIQVNAEAPLLAEQWELPTEGIQLRLVRLDPILADFEDKTRTYQLPMQVTFGHLLAVYREWFSGEMAVSCPLCGDPSRKHHKCQGMEGLN